MKIKVVVLLCVFMCFCGCRGNADASSSSAVSTAAEAVNELIFSVDKESVSAENLTICVQNCTLSEVSYSSEFFIDKKVDGEWQRIDITQKFNALGVTLKSGDLRKHNIRLIGRLEKGEYRIVKTFVIASQKQEYNAEFAVGN